MRNSRRKRQRTEGRPTGSAVGKKSKGARRRKPVVFRDLPFELQVISPLPPVDRRWLIAKYFAERGQAVPVAVSDRWIHTAWIYLKAQAERDEMATASGSQFAGRDEDTFLSKTIVFELQARILAGQSNGEIAQRFGIAEPEVESFEKLQFSVRDRLGFPAYIVHVAIGSEGGHAIDRLGRVWKLLGYTYGSNFLNYFVDTFRSFPGQIQSRGIDSYTSLDADCPPLISSLIQVRELQLEADSLFPTIRRLFDSWAAMNNVPVVSNASSSVQLKEFLSGFMHKTGTPPDQPAHHSPVSDSWREFSQWLRRAG